MYARTNTKLDIAYCTNHVSHFSLEPCEVFYYALIILQQLTGTVNKGLKVRGKVTANQTTAYTNVTYNSDN